MRLRAGVVLLLAALSSSVLAAGAAGAPRAIEFEGHSASLALKASNGYSIAVSAFSERRDGKGDLSLFVSKRGQGAVYTAPATVTETALRADLGPYGRIDAVRRGLGREKAGRARCGGPRLRYEPALYEGVFQFEGEGGYVSAAQASAAEAPDPFLGFSTLLGLGCNSGGSGESLNSERLPGARLKGVSYAGGRVLKFQVNKNRPAAPMIFSAELRERRGPIRIYRTLSGRAPARGFDFAHSLRTASMAPAAPFSGAATLDRSPDSVLPLWRGDLALDFAGAPGVRLAGPEVHVSLVHARLTRGSGATVRFRPGARGAG